VQDEIAGTWSSSADPAGPVRPGDDVGALGSWRGLLRTGAVGALTSVGLILVQVVIFAAWPPPTTTEGFYRLLDTNPLLGLVSLDLLYIVNNVAVLLLYLALAVVLWRTNRSAVTLALSLGFLGMTAYMASTRAVEMLALARAYETAGQEARAALVAAGDGMLATWQGTAFDVYYLLNAVALAIFAVLMHRSPLFNPATGRWGLAAALLMTVPSNVGLVGMAFALGSLVPWSVFAVLAARRLLRLGVPSR